MALTIATKYFIVFLLVSHVNMCLGVFESNSAMTNIFIGKKKIDVAKSYKFLALPINIKKDYLRN